MSYGTVQAEKMTTESGYSLGAGNASSFKNRIINGAMVIDQRNAGASVTVSTSGAYPVDRFYCRADQNSKYTVQQNAGSVTPPAGFNNYLGATVISAYSVGANETFDILQNIEGLNCTDLGWGTANAKTVTLSFWVRSSLTGTFGGSLRNSAADRSYPFSYTISSANTWEQKTITVAGDTTGTWLTTNGTGIGVIFSLSTGSNRLGTAGAWAGTNYLGATGQTQIIATNGATFYITGVQLEVGSTATSFDYRPYGTELALCQRYYQKVEAIAPSAGRTSGTTDVFLSLPLLVALRASPTLSDGGVTYLYSGGARVNSSGGTLTVNSYDTETTSIAAVRTGFTGLTDDRIVNAVFTSNVTISSEL